MSGCTLRRLLAFKYMAVYKIDGSIVAAKITHNNVVNTIARSLCLNCSPVIITNVHPGYAKLKPVTLPKNSITEIIKVIDHDVINIPARILPASLE